MIFRQLLEPKTSTYTYLLGCTSTRQAILIDPVLESMERDVGVLKELKLTLAYTIETHVHADHITSARKLKALTDCKVGGPAAAKVECYDVDLEDNIALEVGTIRLMPVFTPGHTDHHFAYLTSSSTHNMVFTGDSLMIDGCGRTDFQNGDAKTLYKSVYHKLFTLPDETLVYPGHDYDNRRVSSIGEEKARNERLREGTTEAQFVDIMANLNLPKPRMMEFAVPGNVACGQCPPNVPPELKAPCEINDLRQG